MGDYLASLVARTLRPADSLRPRPRARFEPLAREGPVPPVEQAASPGLLSPPSLLDRVAAPSATEREVERRGVGTFMIDPAPSAASSTPPAPRPRAPVGSRRPEVSISPERPPVQLPPVQKPASGKLKAREPSSGTAPRQPPAKNPEEARRRVPSPPAAPVRSAVARPRRPEGTQPLESRVRAAAASPERSTPGPSRSAPIRPSEKLERETEPQEGREELAPPPRIRPAAAAPIRPREPERARPSRDAEGPTVRVTIGRVEIRAVPPKPPAPVRTAEPRRPALSLDQYLERRNRGRA